MPNPRNALIIRSRDRDFLLRWAVIIGIAAIILGFVLGQFGPAKGRLAGAASQPNGMSFELEEYIRDQGGLPDQISLLERLFQDERPPPEVIAALIRSGAFINAHFSLVENDLRPLFINYADALHGQNRDYAPAKAALLAAAAEQPPPRFANAFAGHLLQLEEEHRPAADLFAAEVRNFPQTSFARRAELVSLLELDDTATLRERTDDILVETAVPPHMFTDALIATGQWLRLAARDAQRFILDFQPAWAAIALFAAMVWFIIIGNLGGLESGSGGRMTIYLVAFVLGCASAFLVMPAIYFQSRVIGLNQNGEFLNDAVFFISGVALREELFKLLLFVPLIPILLKHRSSMEALAAAGCVGLGFAFIENFGYTRLGNEGNLFARLITANFVHIGWTGLNGLALFHLCRWPKTRWEEFLATILATITAHGLYNLFAGGTEWSDAAARIPPIVIIAFTAYRYLDTATEHRDGPLAELSPLGVFVLGGVLVAAFSWLHACWHQPMADVVKSVGGSALSIATVAFVFINRLLHE